MKEEELMEEFNRMMDITHNLHCAVQVLREGLIVALAALPAEQHPTVVDDIRTRVEGLLTLADDLEGAQALRERIALEAHLLLQDMQV